MEQFIHKVSWFSLVYSFLCFWRHRISICSLGWLPTGSLTSASWAEAMTSVCRHVDCLLFLTWLLRLVTSFQKYEVEIVFWKYSHLGHLSAFHLSLRFFYFLCGLWSVWCVCESRCPRRHWIPWSWGYRQFWPAWYGAPNQIQSFCKSSRGFGQLGHPSSPSYIFPFLCLQEVMRTWHKM